MLNIDIERTGFPIAIAGLEFFFDSSVEGINKYQENYLEALEMVESLEIEEDATDAVILNQRVEVYRQSYDMILGQGAFDQIYLRVGDIIALEKAFFKLIKGIDMHVDLVVKEYSEQTNSMIEEYENKFN